MKPGRSSIENLVDISNLGSEPIEVNVPVHTLRSYITSYTHNTSLLGRIDCGGPFELFKVELDFNTVTLRPYCIQGDWGWWCGGTYAGCFWGLSVWPELEAAQNGIDLMAAAARFKAPHAIQASNPSKPESDLLVAVVDTVKDGLPHIVGSTLWRDKALTAKHAGSEYLNVEFGWKPLIKDIKDFARVVLHSSQYVEQYERGSGKRQRKGYKFPSEDETTYSGETPFVPTTPINTSVWVPAVMKDTVRTETKVWFEGAFRYYLAPSGISRYVQLASKLYGVSLTPDKLWELAPWTWALDWFGNIGDVIANISLLGPDATAMEWGYMMSSRVKTTHRTQPTTGVTLWAPIEGHPDASGKTVDFRVVETVSSKLRIQASPYSFAVAPAALTVKQSAILVALGLSHMT